MRGWACHERCVPVGMAVANRGAVWVDVVVMVVAVRVLVGVRHVAMTMLVGVGRSQRQGDRTAATAVATTCTGSNWSPSTAHDATPSLATTSATATGSTRSAATNSSNDSKQEMSSSRRRIRQRPVGRRRVGRAWRDASPRSVTQRSKLAERHIGAGELLHPAPRVLQTPQAGEPSPVDTEEVHLIDAHRPTGRGKSLPFTVMGAGATKPGDDRVVLGDQLTELLVPVRERRPELRERVAQLPRQPGRAQLVEHIEVVAVHHLLDKTLHQQLRAGHGDVDERTVHTSTGTDSGVVVAQGFVVVLCR